jgi:hypothetical protein
VRLEGLGQLKKYNDLIGTRTRDLPACSKVPNETRICLGEMNFEVRAKKG